MADKLYGDLVNRLRIVSNMINMGEKISWGEETSLMNKAADAIEKLQSNKHMETDCKHISRAIGYEGHLCGKCGQFYQPSKHYDDSYPPDFIDALKLHVAKTYNKDDDDYIKEALGLSSKTPEPQTGISSLITERQHGTGMCATDLSDVLHTET